MEYITEIALAAITTIGAAIGAYFKFKTAKVEAKSVETLVEDKELTYQEKENLLTESGTDLIAAFQAWADMEIEIKNLLDDTVLDRFVLLRAWNGIREPDKTTAVYQYKSSGRDYIKYVGVELDRDYTQKLASTYNGPVVFSTKDQQGTLIKNIYDNEGIKSAAWFYIISEEVKGVKEKSTVYCSFASTSADSLDSITVMRAQMIVSRIKGIMHKYGNR